MLTTGDVAEMVLAVARLSRNAAVSNVVISRAGDRGLMGLSHVTGPRPEREIRYRRIKPNSRATCRIRRG